MILIVGAKGSGKKHYAQKVLGYRAEDMADGILNEKPLLVNLQDLVAKDSERSMELLGPLLKKELILCREIGSGVIPISREERLWREATGRLCNSLAQEAERVVRMVCGLPTIIKGK